MNSCGDANTPATLDCLFKTIFPNAFKAGLIFVSIIIIAMTIFGGIKFITSRGDNKQLEGARKTITYAVIGALVVLFSVFIINFIGTVTGVTCIRFFGYDSCS